MKIVAIGFLSIFLTINGFSQNKKDEVRMDKMWGDQEQVNSVGNTSRTKLFDEGNYAMFIHWGIYSNIGNLWNDTTYYGISEWIKRRAHISVKDYMEEAKKFNPMNFDAKAIARLAKDAGMKYIIVTSKHHDGFTMYDSKVNDFNIVEASPFGRDPMKELARACKEEGLGFGFYYSHNQDWTFPGGNGGPKETANRKEVGFDYYFREKCLPQVEEITKDYGPITLVWFDTPGDMEKKYIEQLVAVVHKNQPNALVSGRAGHNLGDYKSLGDMEIPIENIEGLWETVDVTNDTWGYGWYAEIWKSPKQILTSVISTVARGGTFMLNIGPKPDGTIPVQAQMALRTSGEWIKRYPGVIYNAGSSPWGRKLPWGDVTVSSSGKLNLCIYKWPLDGELFFPGLKSEINTAGLWIDGELQTLQTVKDGNWTIIKLPVKRPEQLVSVVELNVSSPVEVDWSLSIDPIYETKIPVAFASAEGCEIKEKNWMEKFGEWKHISQAEGWTPESRVILEVEVMKPGYYEVDLNYAGNGRMVWRIENEEGVFVQNQQNSSAIYNYFEFGLMKFNKPGRHKISVSFVEGDRKSASLKEIKFTPWDSVE